MLITEQNFHFVPIQLDPDVTGFYIRGFWQSERYFSIIESLIRSHFQFKQVLTDAYLKALDKISTCNAVSLHIRRGDYCSDEAVQKVHPVCPISYYDRALKQLSLIMSDLQLFVFSDDVEWCKQHFSDKYPIYFIQDMVPANDVMELQLITHCKHHIIANSTFSWWGAWLCTNPNKQVIAPKNWFKDEGINTKDLTPDSWILI